MDEHHSHLVRQAGRYQASQIVEIAVTKRAKIDAVCGYRWIPTDMRPVGLPVCPDCLAVLPPAVAIEILAAQRRRETAPHPADTTMTE